METYAEQHYQQLDTEHLLSPAGNTILIATSGKGRYILASDPVTGQRSRVYLDSLKLVPTVHHRSVSKYRQNYRTQLVEPNYSAYWHFALMNLVTVSSICIASYWTGNLLQHWLLTLVTFLACNVGEWYTHRYSLHERGARNRHTIHHHRFFTDHLMSYDTFQDGHVIFFPLYEPFVLVATALVTVLPFWCYRHSAAATVFRVLMFYYCGYEWLHLAYHSPPSSWLGRLPGIAYLRRHHQQHHCQALMGKYNFNVTFPLADWILGTCYRE
jgi:hypothetical protein